MVNAESPLEREKIESHPQQWTESKFGSKVRMIVSPFILIGVGLLGIYFCCFLVYHSLRGAGVGESWLLKVIDGHFAATIAVPLSGVSAVCVVLTLRATAGPIELEAWGVKFRGASGPLVFWLLVFAAFILGVKFLWALC